MEPGKEIQKFNEKNSLYYVIYNYIIRTRSEFYGKRVNDLSKKSLRKIIVDEGVLLNKFSGESIYIYQDTYKVNNGDSIEFSNEKILFTCIFDNSYNDLEENTDFDAKTNSDSNIKGAINEKLNLENNNGNLSNQIDTIVQNYLIEHLGVSELKNLLPNKQKLAFAVICKLFQEYNFEKIKDYSNSYDLTDFLRRTIKDSNIHKEVDLLKNQKISSGKLIEILLKSKSEIEINLNKLNNDLNTGQYFNDLFVYFRYYKKIVNTEIFQYLISPLLNNSLSSFIAIQNLLKLVNKAKDLGTIEEKIQNFESNKHFFSSYFEILDTTDDYNKSIYTNVVKSLFNQFKIYSNTSEEKSANLIIEPNSRRYNFSNIERIDQDVFFIITNNGEGLAKDVTIFSDSKDISFGQINIGILKPNERREIKVLARIDYNKDFKFETLVQCKWEEISGKQNISKTIIKFLVQRTEIPWDELRKRNPYSNSIIESPDKLFGRNEILDDLKVNILSDNIESYKLWGQKRVGKSSIVKTLKSILDNVEKTIIIYRSIGGLKNADPIQTLNSLGGSLCTEIYEEIDRKIKDHSIREQLRSIKVPLCNGSLLPLETYIKQLKRIENSIKFVFILDEFDRINEEFFLPGTLGEILSLGIGKGLNEEKFIGFILVGSENMQLLDRQGINYNSYQEREVDTFNKKTEYDSFAQIIKGPVAPYINYSDEAVENIFVSSNGNPYFANLICSIIFKNSFKYKDSEVDIHSVESAIETIINSSQKSHFEHYWSDGITEEINIKKERKADVRKRLLVSYTMSPKLKNNIHPNKKDISKNFKHPHEAEYLIEEYEIENTIIEFINRKIFIENNLGEIFILPNLFEKWLCSSGKTLMIEGVSDLQALQREINIEKELTLKKEELIRLSENYQFLGKKIPLDDFENYFKQFGGATEQRRIFRLLDSVLYISKDEILDFLRRESRNIFKKSEIIAKENVKKLYREGVELYTFSRYYDENVQVGETFKISNRIRLQKSLKIIKDDPKSWKKNESKEIIIIQPIIDSFLSIQEELFILLDEEAKKANITIRIISYIITTKAKADLISATSSFANLKIISLKELEETKIKPFISGTEIFENSDESNLAFYEVRKHFPEINKDVLLVVFEDFCPSISCPILWFQNEKFNPIFPNLHGVLDSAMQNENGEHRRDKLYFLAKELSQKINQYMISYLSERSRIDNEVDWFILKYIPRKTLDNVNRKWLDEGQKDPRESYFDFIDYKDIIKNIKDSELHKKFMIGEKEQYEWLIKCNELRRDPAHPEKPCPTQDEVDFFEKIKNIIIPRLVQ